MALNQIKIKQLKSLGHKLKPIVIVGENGLGDNHISEIERALNDHELIKVKFATVDREAKNASISETASKTQSTVIQSIGKVALLYRPAKQPNKKLSNLHRPL